MQQTETFPGYGGNPFMMDGGSMPMGDPMADPMAGGDPASAAPAPAEQGGMMEIQPMVEAYMQNPDPALAEEIIMSLANQMGIAPPMEAPVDPAAAAQGGGMADPMAGAGPQFAKGGKLSNFLAGLKL